MHDGRVIDQTAIDELRHQPIHLARAQEKIDLGERFLEFLAVPLDHAAHGDDRPRPARLFQTSGFDDRIDRFFLRGVDEAAGVHENDVRILGLLDGLGAAICQLREVAFGVNGVFVAAQRDDRDLHR